MPREERNPGEEIAVEVLHLYCIAGNGTPPDLGLIGLGGHQVFAVRHRDLAAVVSPSPMLAYKSMKKEEVIPYLFVHQAVIERVMEGGTVVPVKFGTAAQDQEEVRNILAKGYPRLKAALEAMQGKIELDVVVLWRELNPILQQIGGEEEIRRCKEAIAGRPPEETLQERMRIGQMVNARLDRRRQERAAKIVEALRGLALDVCLHALVDDPMILNAAVLLERGRQEEVAEALERLTAPTGEQIDFRCIGPLPPYSFSTVEIRRFEVEQLDRARRILGLGERATLSDLKGAYRRLAHQCHPDKGVVGQEPGGRLAEVTEAYKVLADYCEADGRAFRELGNRDAVAVKLFHWGADAGGA